MSRSDENDTGSDNCEQPKQDWVRSGNEHDDKCGHADQCGRPEIDFKKNQREQGADNCQGYRKSEEWMIRCFFITGEPPRQKKYCRHFCDLGRLKTRGTERDPTA